MSLNSKITHIYRTSRRNNNTTTKMLEDDWKIKMLLMQ